MTDPYAAPDWYDPSSLVRRLRGSYATPINDGLGHLEGETIIDGKAHWVSEFPGRPDVQIQAAQMIECFEQGAMMDGRKAELLIDELKKPADPLNIGQKSIVPIHREAIARIKEFLP